MLFLEESLQFNRTSVDFFGPASGTFTTQSENLGAVNRFYGGEVGAEWEFRLGPVFFLTKGKLAFGVTDVNPDLTAFTRTQTPVALTGVVNQGLYVSPATGGDVESLEFRSVAGAGFQGRVRFQRLGAAERGLHVRSSA